MVFCSFIRAKCYPFNMKFFQSSASYMNNQSLTKHLGHYTKRFGDGPHPSQHSGSYIIIGVGHYGLYYSIYNRETDKQRANGIDILYFNPLINFHIPIFQNTLFNFAYDNVNQGIYNHIHQLKMSSSNVFSSFSMASKRSFSTVSSSHQKHSNNVNTIIPKLKELEEEYELKVEATQYDKIDVAQVDDFETRQFSKINQLFREGDYELIYPIYQSLKRNDIAGTSIDFYNKVLKSLIYRNLNSKVELEEIEIKLTNILTVYQDILQHSCESLKPNTETFNLVSIALLDGSLNSIKYNKTANLPVILYNDSFVKSQEFIAIAVELLTSIKDFQTLNLNSIYPKLFPVLNHYPNLINQELLSLIFNNLIKDSNQFNYYNELIKLTEHFSKHGCLVSNKECYDFLFHVYGSYQKTADLSKKFSSSMDFKIYESIIIQLIRTDNFEVATKFLDEILIQFRKNYSMTDKKSISNLISKYLAEVSNIDMEEAYKLMKEFNRVNFVPELSMELSNGMIDRFVQRYYSLEASKQKNESKISKYCEEQQRIYNCLWEIVNYNLVRKDFLVSSSLLSFSIDINDYDNIFKMTKILLLSDQLVDLTVVKKLLSYYSNGLQQNFEVYYDLMINIIEHQSKFYNDYRKLNDYFSEVVDFMIIPNNQSSFQTLINSPMVKEIFNKFDLVNDKIYGLIKLSKYFLSYSQANNLSNDDLCKVLNYESILINQFEDPELVYINLDEDLTNFKNKLCSHFEENYNDLEYGTTHMINTLSFLENSSEKKVNKKIQPIIDLTNLFNVNYHIGVYKFIENFKKDNTFSNGTLKILTDKEFLLNHLSRINLNKFVKMYLSCGDQSIVDTLLAQNIDKISIAILKNSKELPETTFNICLENCLKSSNKYFFNLLNEAIGEAPLDTVQVSKYLRILMKYEQYDTVQGIFDTNPDLVYVQSVLVTYLKFLLVTKQTDKFAKVVRDNFNDKDAMKSIMENDQLRSLINDFYFITKSDMRIPKKEKSHDIDQVADLLFSQLGDVSVLKSLFESNRKLININQQLVLGNLLNKITDYKLDYRIIWNFCNVSEITKLSVANFKKLVNIMFNLKDEASLNLLFQKFLNGQKISNYLKFDLFEILISNRQDKIEVLSLFKDCFKKLNNKVNLARIDNYSKQHQICL